jgi:hypothetical protein
MDITLKMRFEINIHTQILNTICSQYKGISESVLIIQNVSIPGTKDDSNFIKIKLKTKLNYVAWAR